MERRHANRLTEPFVIRVVGAGRGGRPFDFTAVLDNVSSGGVYVKFPHELCRPRGGVRVGARLRVAIDLSHGGEVAARCWRLTARGRVLRLDPKATGACGVAIRFTD